MLRLRTKQGKPLMSRWPDLIELVFTSPVFLPLACSDLSDGEETPHLVWLACCLERCVHSLLLEHLTGIFLSQYRGGVYAPQKMERLLLRRSDSYIVILVAEPCLLCGGHIREAV